MAALELTDHTFRILVESVEDYGIYVIDTDGVVQSWNPGAHRLKGYSAREAIGLHVSVFYRPGDRGWQDLIATARREGHAEIHGWRVRKDGSQFWAHVAVTALRDAAGEIIGFAKLTRDLSDRSYRAFVEATNGIVWTADADGAPNADSPTWRAFTGQTEAEWRGRSGFEPVHPEDREALRAAWARARDTAVIFESEFRLRRRDGEYVWMATRGVPLLDPHSEHDTRPPRVREWFGVTFDISARKAAELELERAAARRDFLARASDELIAAADYRDALAKVAQLAVPQLADWCAVEIREPGATTSRQLAVAHVDPEKVEMAHELNRRYPADPDAPTGVPQVLRSGKSELYVEIPPELLEGAARDDEHRAIIRELDLRSAMIVPLRGREHVFGAITFIFTGARRYTQDDLAFAEELARRAAMVIERRRLEEEAAVASRAKDEFLAMLGHELRNPLAPIRTALQLMTLRGDQSTLRERQVIERQVEHLVTLVDDLLDVSRITRAKITLAREPLEIGAVIARALEIASPLLEQRRHQLELEVPRTGLRVEGDPARLAQVFSNLLTNAAKYTDPGGTIMVSARREGPDIVVAVRDTGVGIPPEVLPTVFDMFVQETQSVARSQGGLGLGLSIAKSLAQMHGGSITAASAGRGQGSTFTVRLPALTAPRELASQPSPAALRGPGGGHRVLLVDDNADAVALLEELLQSAGYETRIAHDGPSALATATTFRPELAVLDIGLPVMDGYELAQRIRAQLSQPPALIALTGYGQDDDHHKALAAGFDRHFVKPIDVARLRAAFDELLRSRDEASPRT